MKIVLLLIILACILPYIASFMMAQLKKASFSFSNHEHLNSSSTALQQNNFESLILFLAAVLFAVYMIVPIYIVQLLSIGYLTFRSLYILCILGNWSILRQIMWWLSLGCSVMLFGISYYLA